MRAAPVVKSDKICVTCDREAELLIKVTSVGMVKLLESRTESSMPENDKPTEFTASPSRGFSDPGYAFSP
jgi:hypothetical protein